MSKMQFGKSTPAGRGSLKKLRRRYEKNELVTDLPEFEILVTTERAIFKLLYLLLHLNGTYLFHQP